MVDLATPFTPTSGSVKLREVALVEANRLFELIDSIPMRQREMIGQNRN